jgi:hypothetical protein
MTYLGYNFLNLCFRSSGDERGKTRAHPAQTLRERDDDPLATTFAMVCDDIQQRQGDQKSERGRMPDVYDGVVIGGRDRTNEATRSLYTSKRTHFA